MLRWHLDHREQIEGYRRYQELTGRVPDDFRDAPKLNTITISAFGMDIEIPKPRIQLAWNGFCALSGSRMVSMGGHGNIPYAQIRAYLDEEGIGDLDDRNDLFYLIGRMDQEHLSHGRKNGQSEYR